MIALRQDPQATLALVSFIVVGVLACLLRLWWLWWTLWEYPCGHKPCQCSCSYAERNKLDR